MLVLGCSIISNKNTDIHGCLGENHVFIVNYANMVYALR